MTIFGLSGSLTSYAALPSPPTIHASPSPSTCTWWEEMPVVGGLKIDVDTFKGVVTLSGGVKSRQEEQTAIALARKIKGVVDVKSTLQVTS